MELVDLGLVVPQAAQPVRQPGPAARPAVRWPPSRGSSRPVGGESSRSRTRVGGERDRRPWPRTRAATSRRRTARYGRRAPAVRRRRRPTARSSGRTRPGSTGRSTSCAAARPRQQPGRDPPRPPAQPQPVSATVASGRGHPVRRPTGSAAASRARARSRSTSRQPNAASTKNISTRSSSAVRLITKCSPSTASSAPARQPRTVERNSRRPIRHSISTESVPSTRHHEPPAEGVQPEQPLAERDDPLADRRVHDVARRRSGAGLPADRPGSGSLAFLGQVPS